MFKSILSLFGSRGTLILRFMLTVASLIGMIFCGVTAFQVPMLWGGVLYLLGCVGCAGLFMWLVWPRKDEDDREPPEEDRNR